MNQSNPIIRILKSIPDYCKIFLEIDQMVHLDNMHVVPIKKSSCIEVRINSSLFEYNFDKIYTTGQTPKKLKKDVLLPLLNTVVFEGKDSTILIVGTNGASKSSTSGMYDNFQNESNVLSIALKYICDYQNENSSGE